MKNPAPPLSSSRQRLVAHLDAVKRQREEVSDVAAQWRRLQAIKQAETNAREKLAVVKARDAAELAEQLVRPTGLHVIADHEELGHAEFEVGRTGREADVARACEAEVVERQTTAHRQLQELETRTAQLAARIAVEEANAIAADIGTTADGLRGKYARLWGMKNLIGETETLRALQEQVPFPMHPDSIQPAGADVFREAATWRRYIERLALDPKAKFQEE